MKLDHLLCLSSILVASGALASCGGKPAAAVRPADFTAKEALGGAAPACTGEPKLARPLIVDLDADARVDLEAAMKKGVVVVAYDCNTLRVLSNCKLADGSYEYVGVGRKEMVVQMKGADEVKVNLPLSAAKLGAEVQAGRSVDLGLVYVGRRTTVVGHARRADLTGSCDGATHYLQNATIGAFALSTGSTGKVAAVADVFSVGASGKSEASKSTSTSDGSLEACRKSDPAAATPPAECGAPLRVELIPLVGKATPAANDEPPAPDEAAEAKKTEESKVEENPCKAGYVYADGRCTKPTANEAHLCDPKDADACKAQCDKGSAGSCFNYGVITSRNKGDGTPSFTKACDGGEAEACARLAADIRLKVHKPSDDPAAFERGYALAKKACEMGSGPGCYTASAFELVGNKDATIRFKFYQRGCGLGDRLNCRLLASAYINGIGVAKDVAKGADSLMRGCQGGDESACGQLVTHLQGSDPTRALGIATKTCDANVRASYICEQAAAIMVKQDHFDQAAPYAKKACDGKDTWCRSYIKMLQLGKGAKKDPAAADVLIKKICADKGQKISDDMSSEPICGGKGAATPPPPPTTTTTTTTTTTAPKPPTPTKPPAKKK